MARQRSKLEPISIEELLNAPGMSGFVSFLNVKPWESQHVTPVETTPVEATRAEEIPVDSATPPQEINYSPNFAQNHPDSNPLPSSDIQQTWDNPTLVDSTRVESVYRRPRVKEVRVLQDALSFGEEALYNALWSHASQNTSDAKVICIGFERMSQLARLTDKNCKINCRSLIEKRVLEVVAETDFRAGRTYLIYSFKAALQRQKEAGLTHVIRTRGVLFVDPTSGKELTSTAHKRRHSTPVGSTAVANVSTRVDATESTPVISPYSTPVDSSAPIRNRQIRSQSTSASSVALIVQVLRDELGVADDEAAIRIDGRCRANAPDVTEQEIAECVRTEAQRLRSNRRVENPLGLLIIQVPKRFEGETWRQHREQQLRRRESDEQERLEHERFRQEQLARYADPTVSEEEKRLLRKLL
jgi:hypothetical protein